MKGQPVKDTYGLVYVVFVLLGMGTLLPWFVFLTGKEFYDVRFQVKPYYAFVADNFMSLFGVLFNISNLLALALLIRYQRFMSFRTLVLHPLVITLAILVGTAALALRTDVPGTRMAEFTLPSLFLMGACTAMLQGGTLSLASMMSPAHIQGLVSGIALGGVATSALSFFSEMRANDDDITPTPAGVAPAAFTYFGTAAGLMTCCVVGYLSLQCLPYAVNQLKYHGYCAKGKPTKQKPASSLPTSSSSDDDARAPLLTHSPSDDAPGTSASALASSPPLSPALPSSSRQTQQPQSQQPTSTLIGVETNILTQSWQQRYAFTIYCGVLLWTLAVTQMVHPGITSFICSVENPAKVSPCSPHTNAGRYAGDLFVPFMYVVFSFGDFTGRLLAGYGPWGRSPPKPLSLLAYALLRTVVVAGFLFCHVVTPTSWTLPEFLSRDEFPIGLILVLGLTQGHLLSTTCMHAPSTLKPSQQHRYGPVTSFSISIGCFAGSLVSLAVAYVFQTHQVGA